MLTKAQSKHIEIHGAPAPELFFHGSGSTSGFCFFSHINIFNCLCVPQVEWKMKYKK